MRGSSLKTHIYSDAERIFFMLNDAYSFLFNFFQFTYQPKFPRHPLLLLPYCALSYLILLPREGKASLEHQQCLAYQVETGPGSTCSYQSLARNPTIRISSKKLVHAPRISTVPTSRSPTKTLSHTTVTHIQSAYFSPMSLPSCQFKSM